MAQKKKRTTRRVTKKQREQQEKLKMMGLGLVFVLFAGLGLFGAGFVGRLIGNVFRVIGGNTYPVLCVVFIFYGIWLIIKNTQATIHSYRRIIGGLLTYSGLLIILHAGLFAKIQTQEMQIIQTTWHLLAEDIGKNQLTQNVGGGMLGAFLYSITYFLVSQIGSYVIAIVMSLIGLYLLFSLNTEQLFQFFEKIGDVFQKLFVGDDTRQAKRAEKKEVRRQQKEAKKEQKRAEILAELEEQNKNQVRVTSENEFDPEDWQTEGTFEVEQPSFIPIASFQEEQAMEPVEQLSEGTIEDDGEMVEFSAFSEVEDEHYELPTSQLLTRVPSTDQSSERDRANQNIQVLEQTFASFGVDAKVVSASLGPSVTKFEIQPAVGVKVSKIVGLTDDLALALAAKDIRMEAPIPGKSLIGIEVPNETTSMVSFREVIEAMPQPVKSVLEVPLGRDVSGKVQTADLTKMPHLLVAGSTGSGKSVAINGIITSILMQAKPHEVKLMMVDPKMVELSVYNGIPHLLTPVVTNPRKAAQALQKVVKEMEERYEKFAATGVRNITGYNDLIQRLNQETGEKQPILPFIVVIVDELADLMMVASNEVEDAIIRLAQMARAAGIHMILATQRPSVDVITGIIKANVPSRMAFAVSSGTDSRTIIDSNGAEKLLGRGDMLFLPMGENKPIRIQGAFISDQDVENIVAFVTDQQEANYDEKMMVTEEELQTSNAASEAPQDELYEQAKELVIEMQTASVSLLQRRFRVGYNRAARLIDELEAQGVVGPSEGSKPRKVLIETLADTTLFSQPEE